MSPILTIALIFASYRVGKRVISRAIKRRRQRKQEARKAKIWREQRMPPEQKEAAWQAERLKELKANLEKSEAWVDVARLRSAARKDQLMGRSGWDETNLHSDRRYRHLLSRQAKAEIAFNADRLALQKHLLSTAKRGSDSTQKLFSIRCNQLSDGTLTFELPLDAGAAVINEMRVALSRDWGVEMGNLNRARITEHRSNDFSTISIGSPRVGMEKDIACSTVFVYDRDKGTAKPAGEELAPGTLKKVYDAMDEFRQKIREQTKESNTILDREDMSAFITLHTLGLDTVALAFNGVAIAYATAKPDGGIHMQGDSVPVGDKKALKMASTVQERLHDCHNFGQWLDRAIEILHSPENIHTGSMILERKAIQEQSKIRIKKTAERMVNSSKTLLSSRSPKRYGHS